MRNLFLIIAVFTIIFTSSCSSNQKEENKIIDGFPIIIEYFETNGDFINSSEVPFFVNAQEVYQNLKNNWLLIDLRSKDHYDSGHIKNSVNVRPVEIVDYFEKRINPSSFEKIVLICNSGKQAAFCAMCLKYLGYDNVAPIRYGLSAWSKDIAEQFRLKNIGNHMIGNLDTISHVKNIAGVYPVIETQQVDPYMIIRERVINVLSDNLSNYYIKNEDLMANLDKYYLISYWPKERYDKGHLPGAINYKPKSSLRSTEFLNTLPIDKPIVIDCFAGNHANFVVAYLRILGYDAYISMYGSNSYMYDIIKVEEKPGKFFGEKDIMGYPLSSDNQNNDDNINEDKPKINLPQGGC